MARLLICYLKESKIMNIVVSLPTQKELYVFLLCFRPMCLVERPTYLICHIAKVIANDKIGVSLCVQKVFLLYLRPFLVEISAIK